MSCRSPTNNNLNSSDAPSARDVDAPIHRDSAEQLLTEEQLAQRHQRSVKTIRNLRVKGGYVPFLKIGRHVRYRLSDVLKYESSCLRESTSDLGGAND